MMKIKFDENYYVTGYSGAATTQTTTGFYCTLSGNTLTWGQANDFIHTAGHSAVTNSTIVAIYGVV